ncbi:hypothetical protein DSM112329_03201 [Paraconexibacter sp. AEG42_29]|uniref:Leucine-binding protein domain-containing protein n=1 Tax=Paraconexibacter sp. AEG42_29 TaxID=2997339 RepID=A0AAU7AXG8_9ACTN
MRPRVVAIRLCLAAALTLGVAGCGGDDDDPGKSFVGTTLTIYSSLPLQGPHAEESQSIIAGEKLALAEVGGRVGEFTVKYASLDDSTADSKGWDARQSARNARTAAQDRTTIAYLGDFDAGATAITLPTLNEAGILQISPATTLVGLTQAEGADKGEPDKYYPTGKRTFGRVIQADNVQVGAQIQLQKQQGCKRTYVLHDSAAYGKSLTDLLTLLGPKAGLLVSGDEGIDPEADDYEAQVRELAESGADCFFLGGMDEAAATRLFTQIHTALPAVKLFAPNGLATETFAAGLPQGVAKVTFLTNPRLAARRYGLAGRRFLRSYRKAYGRDAGTYGMYGYEAMRLALHAVAEAGEDGNQKEAVIDAFFAVRNRVSPLGDYSIGEDGDTSLGGYGSYRVAGGKLVFERVIAPT